MIPRSILFAILATMAFTPSLSRAVPPPPKGPTIGSPGLSNAKGIQVVAESIALDCTSLPEEPCTLQTTQTLTCGDIPCRGELRTTPRAQLRTRGAGQVVAEGDRRILALGAKGRMRLSSTKTLSYAEVETIDRLFVPAVRARHLILSNYRFDAQAGVVVTFAPQPLRAPSYSATVSIRFPEDWTLQPSANHPEGGGLRNEFTWASARPARDMAVKATRDSTTEPWRGGVIVGLGGMLEREQFRLRVGYEFAMPEWLLYGISIDTNVLNDVVLSPMIEASLPTLSILPVSLSIGAGGAFRVTQGGEAGVRLSATMQVLMIGFNATFDIYPSRSTDHLETTLSALIMF